MLASTIIEDLKFYSQIFSTRYLYNTNKYNELLGRHLCLTKNIFNSLNEHIHDQQKKPTHYF